MDLHPGEPLTRSRIGELLAEARARTLLLTSALTEDELRGQHDRIMSPIVWDLGHIAHFEEVWLLENIESASAGSEGLRGIYNPFEHPRATRDALPLPTLAGVPRLHGDGAACGPRPPRLSGPRGRHRTAP